MSKKLMTLLGKPDDALLRVALSDLEKSTGHQGVDARLVGDIVAQAHKVLRAIGLTSDVTPQEMYQSLRAMHKGLLDADTEFVGLVVHGDIISFCAKDLQRDEAEFRGFADRSLAGMREALGTEMCNRYTKTTAHPEVITRKITHIKELL